MPDLSVDDIVKIATASAKAAAQEMAATMRPPAADADAPVAAAATTSANNHIKKVELPSFDKKNIHTWIRRVEAAFGRAGVVTPNDKFFFIESKLDVNLNPKINEYLCGESTEEKWDEFLEYLPNEYGRTKEQQAALFLNGIPREGPRPTQHLAKIKDLTKDKRGQRSQTRQNKAKRGQTRRNEANRGETTPNEPNKAKQGQTRSNEAKRGQTRPNEVKRGQTRSNEATRGQTRPNEVKRQIMSLQIEDTTVKRRSKPIECICSFFSAITDFFKRIFFCATVLFAAVMYIVDIGSDIKLAVRYFLDRHNWWGGWTTAFVAIPWLTYRVGVGLFFGGNALDGDVESRLVILAAIFNLIPVAILVVAAKERWEGKLGDAEGWKLGANWLRLVEVGIEAFPQMSLQLCIVAQSNRLDTLLIVSILSSVYSVVDGMYKGGWGWVERKSEKTFGFLASLIFLPWLIFQLISFVPPLAFFASLKTHTSPALMAVIIYFLIHLILSVACTFAFTTSPLPLSLTSTRFRFRLLLDFHFLDRLSRAIPRPITGRVTPGIRLARHIGALPRMGYRRREHVQPDLGRLQCVVIIVVIIFVGDYRRFHFRQRRLFHL